MINYLRKLERLSNLVFASTLLLLLTCLNTQAQTTVQIGTGTSTYATSSSHGGPYAKYYTDGRSSYIYSQTELANAGIVSGCIITAVGFNVPSSTNGVGVVPDFGISMMEISGTTFANTTFLTGQTQVLNNANYTPVVGWNTHTLDNTFAYTGGDLVVTTCFQFPTNSTYTNNALVEYTTTANAEQYYYSDTDPSACTQTTAGYVSNQRPNVQITYIPATACSGAPVAGTAIVSNDSVCIGSNYTVSLSGSTAASGLTYQWYESPVGANSWSPVATGVTFSYTTTMTAGGDMDYFCEIACGSAKDSSTIVTVYQNPFYGCYCASAASNVNDGEIYNVTVGALNNTSTCSQTGGPGSMMNQYSDYTSVVTPDTLYQDVVYPIAVTAGACNGYPYDAWIKIWIDLDQDGAFTSSGEELYSGTTPSTQYTPAGDIATGTINIPSASFPLTGLTRMRVILHQSNTATPVQPCSNSSYNYGETEDYLVYIPGPAAPCATVTAGTIVSNKDSVCVSNENFTLTATGYTMGQGSLQYQWEESPVGANIWTPITNATNPSYTGTQAGDMDYHFTVTCQATSATSSSATVTIGTSPFYTCYCSPKTGTTLHTCCGNYISNVSILSTTLNNSSTTYGNGYYTFYDNSVASQTADMAQGVGYTINVTCPYTGYGADVWVDFDQSGTFDASEYFSLTTSGTMGSGSILIPVTANLGLTGLRVRNWYSPYGGGGACSNSSGYETEDYIVNILPAPSCLPPSALTATNVTSGTADIGWTVNSTATQWQIEYGPTPYTQGTGTIVTTMSNPYSITSGLNPNTQYAFYVRDICGVGDTSMWTAGGTFTTACVAFSAPFVESFNSTSLPSCWTNSGTIPYAWMFGTSYSSPGYDVSSAADHTGTSGSTYAWVDNSYITNTSSPTTVSLTSPIIDISTLTAPQVRYYMISYNPSNSTYGNNKLAVDAYDYNISDWVQIDSVQQSFSSAAWQERSIPLVAVTSTMTQLRFRFGGTATSCCYNDILIDDIHVEEIPTCPTPTIAAATSVTATTADLNWVENGSATQWEIEYGIAPFTLGSGNRIVVSSNPYTLNPPLTPASNYTYFVRSICGPNDTSSWSSGSSFTTACVTFSAPFTESFNSTSTPNCWTNAGSGGSTVYYQWMFGTASSSPGYDVAGATDHTGASGSTYAWVDGSYVASSGLTATLTSPIIDISTLTTPQLRYYVISYGPQTTGNNKMVVDAYDFNIADWVQIDSVQEDFASAAWQERTFPLSGVTSSTTQLRFTFTALAATPFYNDILIDDINVEQIPTCPAPTTLVANNPTTSSLDISWTSNGSATQYQIEYAQGTTGYTPNTGVGTLVGPTGVTNPYTVSGLSQGTPYTFYVREICGAGDTSAWLGPVTGVTAFPATPPNDDCSTAIDISNGSWYYGSTSGATQTLAACDATTTSTTDVWYSFTTGSSAGTISDSVNTIFSGMDAVVQLFSGSCTGTLTSVTPTSSIGTHPDATCIDGPLAAEIEWANYSVAANTTYYIRVYTYGTLTPGAFSIKVFGAPLAIKLDKLSAVNVGSSNKIEWNTFAEERSDKFELERSADGKHFAKIYEKQANGEASRYTYLDNNPVKGYNYYRLRMTEANGNATYSEVVKAFVKSSGFDVEAYPNPVSHDLTVKVNGVQGADAAIQVTDVTGKVIRSIKMTGSVEAIDMTGLANGIYLIKYSDANHTQTIKVNKQ